MPSTALSLETMADQINALHLEAGKAMGSALHRWADLGEMLLQAKAAVKVDGGSWLSWVKQNLEFEQQQASRYMRVAEYRDELVEFAANGNFTSLESALAALPGKQQKAITKPKPKPKKAAKVAAPVHDEDDEDETENGDVIEAEAEDTEADEDTEDTSEDLAAAAKEDHGEDDDLDFSGAVTRVQKRIEACFDRELMNNIKELCEVSSDLTDDDRENYLMLMEYVDDVLRRAKQCRQLLVEASTASRSEEEEEIVEDDDDEQAAD